MLINGVALNIIKTPDQDRYEQGVTGYILHKECLVDALRDNYTFPNIIEGTPETWLGIGPTGLYNEIVKPRSLDKRPQVKIGEVTYQIFAMADDPNDATVKLTARRMQ